MIYAHFVDNKHLYLFAMTWLIVYLVSLIWYLNNLLETKFAIMAQKYYSKLTIAKKGPMPLPGDPAAKNHFLSDSNMLAMASDYLTYSNLWRFRNCIVFVTLGLALLSLYVQVSF